MTAPNPWSREGSEPSGPPQPTPYEPSPPEPTYDQLPYQQPPFQDQHDQPYPVPSPQPSWATGPYGQPGPYGFVPQPHRQGGTVFVLGILSIVFAFLCGAGLVLGIIALALSGTPLREISANPAAYSNGQKVKAGRVCAIIGIVVSALALLGRMSELGRSFG